jgi:hypothetical protein
MGSSRSSPREEKLGMRACSSYLSFFLAFARGGFFFFFWGYECRCFFLSPSSRKKSFDDIFHKLSTANFAFFSWSLARLEEEKKFLVRFVKCARARAYKVETERTTHTQKKNGGRRISVAKRPLGQRRRVHVQDML